MAFGFLIAIILGIAVSVDAKNLANQGIRVGGTSALTWGVLTALLAIVGIPAYLISRSSALRAHAAASPARHVSAKPAHHYCPGCGVPVRTDYRFCAGCGVSQSDELLR